MPRKCKYPGCSKDAAYETEEADPARRKSLCPRHIAASERTLFVPIKRCKYGKGTANQCRKQYLGGGDGFCKSHSSDLPSYRTCSEPECNVFPTFVRTVFSSTATKETVNYKSCKAHKQPDMVNTPPIRLQEELPGSCQLDCLTASELDEKVWNEMHETFMQYWLPLYTSKIVQGKSVLGADVTAETQVKDYLEGRFQVIRDLWRNFPHRVVCLTFRCSGTMVAFNFLRAIPDDDESELDVPEEEEYRQDPDTIEAILLQKDFENKLRSTIKNSTNELEERDEGKCSLLVIVQDAVLTNAEVYKDLKESQGEDSDWADPHDKIDKIMAYAAPNLVRHKRKLLIVLTGHRRGIFDSPQKDGYEVENNRGNDATWVVRIRTFLSRPKYARKTKKPKHDSASGSDTAKMKDPFDDSSQPPSKRAPGFQPAANLKNDDSGSESDGRGRGTARTKSNSDVEYEIVLRDFFNGLPNSNNMTLEQFFDLVKCSPLICSN